MDEYEAAKILLSLRGRDLKRWPEWIPWPLKEVDRVRRTSEEPLEDLWKSLPAAHPKRTRSLGLVATMKSAPWGSLEGMLARMRYVGSAGSGEPSGRDEGKRIRSRSPRGTEKPCCVAPAGSGRSVSGVDRARTPAEKEPMAASSPETPLDYAAAAGSGASSSGDDAARSSPAKRKARGGSAGASSCDEGSSSPAKRPRVDPDAAVSLDEVEPKSDDGCRDSNGVLLFDLNEDITPC